MNANRVCQVCALILTSAIFAHAASAATTYYVKNGGNDDKDGLSDTTAWATIDRVHTAFSAPDIGAGDSVLFKCGSKWAEQLVVSQSGNNTGGSLNYITIGAYGSGARPIIGYDLVFTGWSATAGRTNVYQLTVTPEVFVVDETTTSGTAAGYFRAYSRRTSIQAVEDQVGSSYWTGSTLYVHAYDNTDLTTTLNKTLYGNTRGFAVGSAQNAMDLGAVRTNDQSYIKIQNIHAVNQGFGIGGMNTDHIIVDDCRISGTYTATWFGHLLHETTASHDITAQNCEVRFNGNGLRHYNVDNLIVKDNTLSDSWNRVGGEDRTLVAVIGGFTNTRIFGNDFSEAYNGIEIDVRATKTGEDIYIHHNRFHGDMFRGTAQWGLGTFAGDIHFYHNVLWLPTSTITDPMDQRDPPAAITPKALILSAATNSSAEPFVVYNNTISARQGLFMDDPIELSMKNNVFYDCNVHIVDNANIDTGVTHVRDYNFFYPVESGHSIEWQGTPYTDFGIYKTNSSQETNGKDLDPDFLNDPPDADDVKILAAGEADNAGTNTGAPFDVSTGLDFYGLGIGGQASVGASEGVSSP